MTASADETSGTLASRSAEAPGWRSFGALLPRYMLAALLFMVMLDLLIGVVLRYAVVPITDYFDLPSVSFFWVEEVGEFGLAWLTALAAAVAVLERTHFALHVFVHRLAPRLQLVIYRINHLLIAGFGVLVATYGWQISRLNSMLESPGLGLNLAWLYASAVAGGTLMAVYGLALAIGSLRRFTRLPNEEP
jgi:TRAP-type C4-dicarboxylate transport system permease small subunit